jgi:hypothetical protein
MRASHVYRCGQSLLTPPTADRLRFARDHNTPAYEMRFSPNPVFALIFFVPFFRWSGYGFVCPESLVTSHCFFGYFNGHF